MAPYRVELATTGRATCSATHCKKEGVKIEKGQLRQGVQVTFQEHTSMKWRHWGCVTPAVLHNWAEDSEMDMELVDGYDTLPPLAQEKVKRALEEKHVDDKDWNGDIECNRFDPTNKMAGMFVKTPKSKAKKGDDEDGADDSPSGKKKKTTSKKRGRAKDEDDADDVEPAPAPKKAKGRDKKAVQQDEGDVPAPATKKSRAKARKTTEQDEDDQDQPPPPPKKSRAKKARSADLVVSDEEVPEDEPAPSKKSKAKKASSKPAATDAESKPKRARGRPKKAADDDD